VTLWTSPVTAHGPAPAPLDVLSVDLDAERATLVRTSIGLARDHAPEGWTYVCPSQWGDHEQARAAYAVDVATTVMVGGGDLYRSSDDACSFESVTVEEPWYALDAYATSEAVWLPALLETDSDVTGLLRVSDTGAATVAARWGADTAFRCDTVSSWSASGQTELLAAGANPVPSLWRASLTAERTDALSGTVEVLTGLPEDTSHLELRTIGERGDIWIAAATAAGRELWRGAPKDAGAPRDLTWTRQGAPASSLLGPVRLDDVWLLVRDGALEVGHDDGTWEPRGEVDWTCLDELPGAVIACRLTEVLHVMRLGEGPPETRQLFDMAHLLAPLEGCPADSEAHAACESDWVHFGAEVGLLDTEQLSTPAATAPSGSSEAMSQGGCGVGEAPREEMPLAILVLCSLLLWRRDAFS
jgi:hypothetical protein